MSRKDIEMEKNCMIAIAKVSNGFEVTERFYNPMRDNSVYIPVENDYVFETFEHLTAWLKDHFPDGHE
jgi:hypothetical protein